MPHTSCIITGFALTSLLLFVGCNNGADDYAPLTDDQPEVPEAADDHHHDLGPNGGHIIELGNDEKYHAELLFNKESRKTTIYILDGEAKIASPIDAEEIELHLAGDSDDVELMLAAVPLDGEADGKSSRFESAAGEMPETVTDIEEITGHLHIEIDGTQYSGDIEHDHGHGHGEEGHKHGDGEK